MNGQRLLDRPHVLDPEEMPPRSWERRQNILAHAVVLLLMGTIWMGVAFALGHGGWAAPGGTFFGFGIGYLYRWCVRPKKDWDLRDAPPPPKW